MNIIVGYSGHAYVVIEAALKAGFSIDYYAEKLESSQNPFDLKYIGYEQSDDFRGYNKGHGFVLGIGSNQIRSKIGDLLRKKDEKILTITHPSSQVSNNAIIDTGAFISSNVSVNAFAKVGRYVILNTNCVVEHECIIEEGVHIGPGAVLSGNVKVGKKSFIGANAIIKEGITIGENVIVGAGSTIIRDISSQKKIVGNPGREIS